MYKILGPIFAPKKKKENILSVSGLLPIVNDGKCTMNVCAGRWDVTQSVE